MTRLNRRFVIILLTLVAVALLATVGLHRFQMQRTADAMAALADQKVAEGDIDEAAKALARYVAIRPDDDVRQDQYVRLLADRALAGRSPRSERSLTKDLLKASVARNPDDDGLREKLALFLLDARENDLALNQLEPLYERVSGGKDAAAIGRIGILYANALLAAEKGLEAEKVLESLVDFPDGAAPPEGRAEAFALLAAIKASGRRQPRAAEALLERMTTAYPDVATGWKRLAARLLANGKADAARKAVERARELDADDLETALLEARIALATGDLDRADSILSGPLAKAPFSEPLVGMRSDLATARKDFETKRRVLREGLDALPANATIAFELFAALADADDAATEIRAVLDAHGRRLGADSPAVQYATATLAMKESRWQDALAIWDPLREKLGGDAVLVKRIDIATAECHDALGRPDQAAAVRRRMASLDPGSAMAKILEANNREEAGQIDEALAIAEDLAASLPPGMLVSMPAVWTKLMRLRITDQTRREEAKRDWSKVDALLAELGASDSIDAVGRERLKIQVLVAKGQRDAAIAAAETAMGAHPEDGSIPAQMVTMLIAESRFADAAARIEALPPALRDNADVLSAELAVAMASDRRDSARWLADVERRIAGRSGPEADATLRSLFLTFVELGRYVDAIRISADVLARFPKDARLRMLAMDVAAEQDDAPTVTAAADGIIEQLTPDSPEGRLARATKSIFAVRERRRESADTSDFVPALSVDDLGRLDEARGLLETLEEERPEWADVPRTRATLATVEGDPSAAIGHLRRAMAVERLPLAARRLAGTLVSAGRFAEAVPVIAAIGRRGGPSVDRIRADLLLAAGQREDAARIAADVTPDDCADPDQLSWYAAFLDRVARADEAEAVCRRAIDAAPERSAPRLLLLRLQSAAGRSADVEQTRDSAMTALTGTQLRVFVEGAAEVLGRQPELIAAYRAEAEAAPENPAVVGRLARYLLRQGDVAEGMRQVRRIVDMPASKGTVEATWARRRLAERLTQTASQRDCQQAIDLLAQNVDAEGRQLPADLSLTASILAQRPDPANWRRALGALETLATRRPLSLGERLLRAATEAKLSPRQRGKVREDLAGLAESDEGSIAVVSQLVEMCIEDRALDDAADWMESLRQLAPDAPGTLRLEAKLAVAQDDRDAARSILDRLKPTGVDGAADTARMMIAATTADETGLHEIGDPLFESLLKEVPEAGLTLSRSLAKRHRTAEAIAAVEAVRDRIPPPQFVAALAAILTNTLDDAEAERIVGLAESACDAAAGSTDMLIQRGVITSLAGKTEAAVKTFRELLAEESLAGTARGVVSANLAFLLAGTTETDEPTTLIEGAIAELGMHPDILDTRALVRQARGQTTLALEDMADVILVPTPQRYLHLAAIRADAGDLEGARAAYDRAIEKGLDDDRLMPEDQRRRRRVESLIGTTPRAG